MNTYDMQIVKRDLIGMAQEMKLRGTTLRDELGDNVDEFTKEIIENSRGPSKLDIVLSSLKIFVLSLTVLYGVILLLFRNFDSTVSIYLPIIVVLFIGIVTVLESIFIPVFNMEKSFKKYVPNLIRGLSVFFLLTSDVPKLVRYGPSIKRIHFILIFLVIYAIAYFAHNKHIENLAESSDDIVKDLIDKTK
jgi:cbb3-type cytochrome oxidase subunit 3